MPARRAQDAALNIIFGSICPIATSLTFPVIVSAIVAEKELRLRAMMVQMGLRNSAYWTTTLLSHTMVTLPLFIVFVALGYALQLKWFVRSSALLVFPLFLLWALAQVAYVARARTVRVCICRIHGPPARPPARTAMRVFCRRSSRARAWPLSYHTSS